MAALSSCSSLVFAFLSVIVVAAAPGDFGDRLDGTLSVLPPWVVIVKACSRPVCVGARISPQWILAEAQCTTGYSEEHFIISDKLYPDLRDLRVDQVVTHDKYLDDSRFAISALKTKEVMEGEFIKLADAPPALSSELNVYGWTDHGNGTIELRTLEAVIADVSTCKLVSSSEPDKDLQLCAGSKKVGDCPVDSGGLVVKDDVLVAILPYGASSGCNPPLWRLHLNVAGFREWIRTTTNV